MFTGKIDSSDSLSNTIVALVDLSNPGPLPKRVVVNKSTNYASFIIWFNLPLSNRVAELSQVLMDAITAPTSLSIHHGYQSRLSLA